MINVHSKYSTEQCSAVQCSAVQYSTVQYSTVQYSTVQYSTAQYSTVQYSTVQYSAVQYSTVQNSAVQYSTVQYSTEQCSTVQYSIVQYSTVQYSIVRNNSYSDLFTPSYVYFLVNIGLNSNFTLIHNELFLGDFDDLSGVFERVESGSKISTSSKDDLKDKKTSSVSDFSSIFDDDKFLSSTNELSGKH